jgi:hypothetical protein
MTKASIVLREKLHHFIDKVEDKKTEAMYVLFEQEIEEDIYTDEFKAELDKRYADYKADSIVITEKEANMRINNLIQKLKNK